MKIYLIRHGKTQANLDHLYCGSTDLPLSDQGRAELADLCYAVGEDVQYLTSGMRRTEETLRILFGDVPHRAERDFREVDFGLFEMKSYEQLKDRPDYQMWITGDNFRNIPPQGESGAQMTKRVLAAFEAITHDTVLITHGGVIAAILAHLHPEEEKNRYQWQPKPGRGYLLEDGRYTVL